MPIDKIAYPLLEGLAAIGETRSGGYKAIAAGELVTYKSGRRRMVTRKALEAFVELKQRQSTDSRGQAA